MCKHLLWCYSCGCIRNIQTQTCENIRQDGKCEDHVWNAEDGKGPCPHDALTAFNPYCTVAIVKKPFEDTEVQLTEQAETQSPRLMSLSSEVPTNERNQAIIEMGLDQLTSVELHSKQQVAEEDLFGVSPSSEGQPSRPTLQVDVNLSRRSSIEHGLAEQTETPIQAVIQTGRQLLDRIPESYSRMHTEATMSPAIPKNPSRKPSDSLKSQIPRPGTPSLIPHPGRGLTGKTPTTAPKPNRRTPSCASEIKDPADEMPLFLTKDSKQPIPVRKVTGSNSGKATGVSKLQQPKKWQ